MAGIRANPQTVGLVRKGFGWNLGTGLGLGFFRKVCRQALNSKLKALDMKSRMRDAFAEPSYIATVRMPWSFFEKHGRKKSRFFFKEEEMRVYSITINLYIYI